jgi:hypothetical protein
MSESTPSLIHRPTGSACRTLVHSSVPPYKTLPSFHLSSDLVRPIVNRSWDVWFDWYRAWWATQPNLSAILKPTAGRKPTARQKRKRELRKPTARQKRKRELRKPTARRKPKRELRKPTAGHKPTAHRKHKRKLRKPTAGRKNKRGRRKPTAC